jgi:zinc transporter, ZIP family
MGEALFWGLVAGSSLVIGGLLALGVGMRQRTLGVVMAFGAGVLISAVAYELVEEAFQTSATLRSVAFGLFAGCAAFAIGDLLLDRLGADSRKRSTGEQSEGSPLAIVLGIVLDGIPESAVIGLSLLQGEGVGVAVIVAVFLSNLPEAVAATTGLAASGWKPVRIMGLWAVVMAVTGLASLAGYALLDGASPTTLAFTLAFAGGAILTMLADTMMPEAFEHGGKLVGVATTVGFALAFAITALE